MALAFKILHFLFSEKYCVIGDYCVGAINLLIAVGSRLKVCVDFIGAARRKMVQSVEMLIRFKLSVID